MRRVILDTQSNRHFRGIALEQMYDQRGGLCQIDQSGIMVTTEPINPAFLDYWQGLGFTLPRLFTAGPFDPDCTLSQLVLRRQSLQRQILDHLNGAEARLEFFCIEESERAVAAALGIPPYCNFDVAIALSRKPNFKRFFDEIGLLTPTWFLCRGVADLSHYGRQLLAEGKPFLVKAEEGTGGIACGGMHHVGNTHELEQLLELERDFGSEFLVEEVVNRQAEVSVHWEITTSSQAQLIGIFEQLSHNFGYAGAVWPPRNIESDVSRAICLTAETKLWPALVERQALGFGCCDVIVDKDGNPYWVDLNPRKGAILYVHDMVRRLSQLYDRMHGFFHHEHLALPARAQAYSFIDIHEELKEWLRPQLPGFVVISNVGVIPYGYADITGISWRSAEMADAMFEQAKRRLLRT